MIGDILCQIVRLISGVHPRWLCDPVSKMPRIYFANHSSHLDAFVLYAALPRQLRRKTRVVAAKEYWERGFFRRMISQRIYHPLLIERVCHSFHDDPRNPVNQIIKTLDEEQSIVLFPEGTRNEEGKIQSFKSGLYHICKRRPKVELIPVYLENLNRILPKGEVLFVPLIGSITFGKPISFDPRETKEIFLERARRAVEELEDA